MPKDFERAWLESATTSMIWNNRRVSRNGQRQQNPASDTMWYGQPKNITLAAGPYQAGIKA